MSSATNQSVRHPKMHMGAFAINAFHLRNPYVIAWWSLVYPGFGHLALGSLVKGVFLFLGEIIINFMSHINLAIVYSFNGQFQMAKDVLDTQWLLLYCGILVFSIYDSYRITVESNKLSVLADREYAKITPLIMTATSMNGLMKRQPWVSVAWSIIAPGSAQLMVGESIRAIITMVIAGVIIIQSHALQAIEFTFLGNFAQAKAIINWQWFLNIPSFYTFAIWHGYTATVETNKLFEIEQAQYLKSQFQSENFLMPFD